MPKVKVRLKKDYGKFVRLTDPGNTFTIETDGDIDVDEHVFNRMRKYLEKAPPKPKVIKVKSEKKSDSDSKE